MQRHVLWKLCREVVNVAYALCGLISNTLNDGDKVLRNNAAGTYEARLKLTHAIINNHRFVIIISRTRPRLT